MNTRKDRKKRKMLNIPKEEPKKRKQKDTRKDINKIKEKCVSSFFPIDSYDDISEERLYSRFIQLYTRIRDSKECRIQFLQNKCLVQSSDKKETYIVELYNGQYTCSCGNKYKEYNRKSCKHIIAVCNHHLQNCITDYMTKPSRDIIQLEKELDSLKLTEKDKTMDFLTESVKNMKSS